VWFFFTSLSALGDSSRAARTTDWKRFAGLFFDNQKVGGNLGPYRFVRNFAKPLGEPAVLEFLKGRAQGALAILDKHLSRSLYVLGAEPTIADISMTSYLYYPAEEFGFNIAAQHKNIGRGLTAWRRCPAGRILTTWCPVIRFETR
jgi:glutathione S-transferase